MSAASWEPAEVGLGSERLALEAGEGEWGSDGVSSIIVPSFRLASLDGSLNTPAPCALIPFHTRPFAMGANVGGKGRKEQCPREKGKVRAGGRGREGGG